MFSSQLAPHFPAAAVSCEKGRPWESHCLVLKYDPTAPMWRDSSQHTLCQNMLLERELLQERQSYKPSGLKDDKVEGRKSVEQGYIEGRSLTQALQELWAKRCPPGVALMLWHSPVRVVQAVGGRLWHLVVKPRQAARLQALCLCQRAGEHPSCGLCPRGDHGLFGSKGARGDSGGFTPL